MLPNKLILKLLLAELFLFFLLSLQAQTSSIPFVERRVTLTAVKQPIEKILNEISEQTGCIFSYSAASVNVRELTTVKVVNKPIKMVLSDIFESNVTYKTRRKYIILRKDEGVSKPIDTKILEGYIYDKQTGKQITNASIYDKKLLVSAITNQYGYFRLEVPKNEQTVNLFVSKEGYPDTLLLSSTLNVKQIMDVSINNSSQKSPKTFRSFLPKWLLPHKIRTHSTNLSDSIFRKVQLSLIPMVNTNSLLTGNTKNDVSINLTVGYVYAIQKCEIGAGINIVRTNARVCQLGGAGNIVGGNSEGLQAAGGFNFAHISTGLQAAGAINTTSNKANVQAAGGINIAANSNVQLAGGVNIVKDTAKYQVAAGLNIARDTKVQISGGVNIAQKVTCLQLTAGVNYATDYAKNQISGCINKADTAKLQVSVVNIAKNVKTLQLGIVNITDSCSGIPIGFFSYVRKGYHHLELSIDESSFASLSFRSGVQRLHSSFSAGISTKKTDERLISYGMGIGTSLGYPHKCLFDFDLSMLQFATVNKTLSDGNQFKFYMGIDKKIFRRISLAAGISYNILINKTTSNNEPLFAQIAPYTTSSNLLDNNTYSRSWVGGKVAIRFW